MKEQGEEGAERQEWWYGQRRSRDVGSIGSSMVGVSTAPWHLFHLLIFLTCTSSVLQTWCFIRSQSKLNPSKDKGRGQPGARLRPIELHRAAGQPLSQESCCFSLLAKYLD